MHKKSCILDAFLALFLLWKAHEKAQENAQEKLHFCSEKHMKKTVQE